MQPLTIESKNVSTNIEPLNTVLRDINAVSLELWLPGATEEDFDGDIYLNRIYKITFNARALNEIETIINQLESFDFIHSAEFEFKRKPLYTPNDQYYNNQWFLPAINANDAWDLWTDFGNTPGNQNIILTAYEAQISGTVLKENGEALRNANVTILESGQSDNEYTTVTNIQGGYSVIVTPEKSYDVIITKEGYSSASHTTIDNLNIVLTFCVPKPLNKKELHQYYLFYQ